MAGVQLLLALAMFPSASSVSLLRLAVDASQSTHRISRHTLGCHHDAGYSRQARSLHAEMIWGQSFEGGEAAFTPPLPLNTTWPTTVAGPAGVTSSHELDRSAAATFHGRPPMRIVRGGTATAAGLAGIANRGVASEGFVLRRGKPYEGYLFVQNPGPSVARLVLQLRDSGSAADSALVLAEHAVGVAPAATWLRVNFTLIPNRTTTCVDVTTTPELLQCRENGAGSACVQCGGEFAVGLGAPGEIRMGYASLQPGSWARLGTLPVLREGVELMQSMGVTVLRAGGTFAESGWNRWTEWRGPPWLRKSAGTAVFGDAIVAGWGPFEVLDMAAAAGFEPVLTTAAQYPNHAFTLQPGETACCDPSIMADLVEYLFGNASTAWGRLRHEDGHPLPYSLRYIELGPSKSLPPGAQFFPFLSQHLFKCAVCAMCAVCVPCSGNEQVNGLFVGQIEAMEDRANSLGLEGALSYLWPSAYFHNSSSESNEPSLRAYCSCCAAAVTVHMCGVPL